jgi:hypothetical protein
MLAKLRQSLLNIWMDVPTGKASMQATGDR